MAALYLTSTWITAPSASAFSPSPSAQLSFACAFRNPKSSARIPNTRSGPAKPPFPRASSNRSRIAPPSSASICAHDEALSDLPLSELLDILLRRRIRYAPTATRRELEALIRGCHHDENAPSSPGPAAADDLRLAGGEPPPPRRHRSRYNPEERVRVPDLERTRDSAVARATEPDRRRDPFGRGSRGAARRRTRDRRAYSDEGEDDAPVIDVVFDLPEDRSPHRRRRDVVYDNGLQIFVMGFVEAGKTAAELAMEAARGVLDPWIKTNDEGVWWLDEETGRSVYDVHVVECTREPYGENGCEGDARRRGRRRLPRTKGGRRAERDRAYRTTRHWEHDEPQLNDRPDESLALDADRWRSPLATIESGSTPVRKRPSPRSRNPTCEEGNPKPVYGLYRERDVQLKDDERKSENRHSHHHKQQWKDRLRRKFDAALGLESSSSTHEQSYYDSWKRHAKGMEDSRKTRLREKIKEETESTAAPPPSEAHPSTVPRNRRARMRAAKNSRFSDEPSVSLPRERTTTPKLRLEEKPFWKERGSIASMLFDNRPASWRKDMQKKRRDTLEQLLLSPLGRERTLTSLLLYITRSSLAVFGTLCRWAGVRGTIPQPIVVITVTAVVLSSCRGQHRILSMGLTLLAIRMMGEFIHGSVHGNEFWDDEYDKETHEWVTDDDAEDVNRSNLQRANL